MFEYCGSPSGPALHAGSGASGWGMGHQPADAGEVGFIFPVGIAWLLSLVYSCPSRVFQLPICSAPAVAGLSWWFAVFAYGADLSGLLPALAFLFKFPDTASPVMLGAGQGSFVHKRRYELSGCPGPVTSVLCSIIGWRGSSRCCNPAGCRPPRFDEDPLAGLQRADSRGTPRFGRTTSIREFRGQRTMCSCSLCPPCRCCGLLSP